MNKKLKEKLKFDNSDYNNFCENINIPYNNNLCRVVWLIREISNYNHFDEKFLNLFCAEFTKILIDDFKEEFKNDDIDKIRILLDRNDTSSNLYRDFVCRIFNALPNNVYDNFKLYYSKDFDEAVSNAEYKITQQKIRPTISFINNKICKNGIPQKIWNKYISDIHLNNCPNRNYLMFSDGTKWEENIKSSPILYLNNNFYSSKIIIGHLLKLSDKIIYNCNPFTLLEIIKKECSEKNYYQITDYIRTEINKTKFCSICLENNLILSSDDAILKAIYSSFYIRFVLKMNIDESKISKEYLLYPIFSPIDIDKKIKEGQEIFENFIEQYFGENLKEQILKILLNIKESKIEMKYSHLINANSLLDFSNLYQSTDYNIKIFFSELYDDNIIIKRTYLLCYLAKECCNEKVNSFLYNHYYWLFRELELNGYKGKHLIDNTKNNKIIKSLNKNLEKYNISITNNEYRDNYIISLMDFSYANAEQVKKFVVLEQIGDAIFELAICNILYNDISTYEEYIKDGCENFSEILDIKKNYLVSFKAQIKIAKNLKLHKMYLHHDFKELTTANKERPYLWTTQIEYEDNKNFADSYEMLIGSIYLEYGLEKALNFANDTFLDTFKEYNNSLSNIDKTKSIYDIINDFNYENDKHSNKEILYYYFDVISPKFSYCINFYDNYYKYYNSLANSLYKLSKIVIYGNDTLDKRIYINDISICDANLGYNMVYEYLTYGFDTMINKLGVKIKETLKK